MEDLINIAKLLDKAGYKVVDCPKPDYLCIKDPTCVWPIVHEFMNNAWIVLVIITAFLLAGWGITMLRGASHDMVKNIRTLVLIFGSLSVALPAADVLGLGKAIVDDCKTIEISMAKIREIQQDYNFKQEVYEEFEIIDTEPRNVNY